MKKGLLVFTLCLVFVFSAEAQIIGLWKGNLHISGQTLKLNIKFYEDNGKLSGNLDIPQQSAIGLKLSNVEENENNVKFEFVISSNNILKFDGNLIGDSIKGDFQQTGFFGKFQLQKETENEKVTKNENEEEVVFYNGEIKLCGTLSIPDKNKKNPAIVLISGSGAQTRDEEIFGFPIFKIISDTLTKNGFAVLRFDDRGIGCSEGILANSNYDDLTGDIISAVNLLKGHKEIDVEKIGILGHSEGGIIAPITASKTKDISFIISLAGSGDNGSHIVVEQSCQISRLSGVSEENIVIDSILNLSIHNTIIHDTGWANSESRYKEYWINKLNENPAINDSTKQTMLKQTLESNVGNWKQVWLKAFLTTNPIDYLEKTTIPVLAIFAEKDCQVIAPSNSQKVKNALKRAGNKNYKTVIIPNANHLFQVAETGLVSEYSTLKKEFEPSLLPIIVDWLKGTVK
jgi:pimeloyl-ACP methyl ester carboxylesterase